VSLGSAYEIGEGGPTIIVMCPWSQSTPHHISPHHTTQDLLAAQAQLAAIFGRPQQRHQPLPQDSATAAMALEQGRSLEPGLTIRALVEQIARRLTRDGAVDLALMVSSVFMVFLSRS
jgi:hypothetical protein